MNEKVKTQMDKMLAWWFDRNFFMSNFVWVAVAWVLVAKSLLTTPAYIVGLVAMIVGTAYAMFANLAPQAEDGSNVEPTPQTLKAINWWFGNLGFMPRGAWIALVWLIVGHNLLVVPSWLCGMAFMIVFTAWAWSKDLIPKKDDTDIDAAQKA